MKITILTLGTRGDVQPYAVLGQALKKRGHDVTLSTAKNFEELVRSYEIDYVPIEADYQAVLNSEDGKKMMKGNPFAIKRNLHTWVYPLITHSLTTFYNLAKDSDIVLYHVKSLADCFADSFPQKMIRTNVLPIVEPTREFANPALSGLPIPGFLNTLSYRLTKLSTKMLAKPIRTFRENMGLSKNYISPRVKNLYGISAHFLPLPHDFPTHSKFTGFWFENTKSELDGDLLDFIYKGDVPLVLTFGSMPFNSKFDLQTALLKLTDKFGVRVIVIKGWGLENTSLLENNPKIKVISSAPYEKLFPLTRAIIHHGGIGTTAACLRAGKPFLICPILYPIGDQMFWGKQAHKLGIAVKPTPLSKTTERIFLNRVNELLTNQEMYNQAKKIQILIDEENGLEQSIIEIEKHFLSFKVE